MTVKGYTESDILENLKAAGCTESEISAFNACKEDKQGGLNVLDKYRETLLSELHTCQQKIDDLDYLRYIIRKEN